MTKDNLDKGVIDMSAILKGAAETAPKGSAFSSIIDEDAARRASQQDSYEPGESGEASPDLVKDLQALSGVAPPPPPPPPAASKDLTQAADVPYYGVTDGIGRELATKIAEGEQRLSELANDIEAARTAGNQLLNLADTACANAIRLAHETREKQAEQIISLQMQEVAILRGRETDQINALGVLRSIAKQLQR